MDLTNMLNNKGPAAVAAKAEKFHTQLAQVNTNIRAANSYPSPSELQQPMSRILAPDYGDRHYDNLYSPSNSLNQQNPGPSPGTDDDSSAQTPNSAKSFPCGTCGKGFARRSDLARHERIHSGDRPHVCPEEGCGKPFIQRSALTVHMRVHSGEKPHMCERCGKPFSDSSSLARHRRIHSGKRPYKCPFADCQKTFTRRTTLTRHQNHHKGTVEEAAAATASRLASRVPGFHPRSSSVDGGNYSDSASIASATPPSHVTHDLGSGSTGSGAGGGGAGNRSDRTLSMSPSAELPPQMPALNRFNSSSSYNSVDSLPLHLRIGAGLQQPSPRSSPSTGSPSPSAFGNNPAGGPGAPPYLHRPSLTSHPVALPVLEPKTYPDLRHQQPSSAGGSPHMSGSPHHPSSNGIGGNGGVAPPISPHLSGGWPSPIHPSMPSPGPSDLSPSYPDLPYSPGPAGMGGVAAMVHPHHHYSVSSHLRRPHSTEPEMYELRPRLSGSVGSGGGGWGSGPL